MAAVDLARRFVIVQGSPRRQGNSSLLADALKEGILASFDGVVDACDMQVGSQSLAQVEVFSPQSHKIAPCIACERCLKTGECVQKDDFDLLAAALEAADVLIWISPLYFGGVSAQLKAIIDRFQMLWARNVLAGESRGIPLQRSKSAFAFYVSAKDDPFATEVKREAALLPLRYASNTAGFTLNTVAGTACQSIVGPDKPGDIAGSEHRASVQDAVKMVLGTSA